MENYPNRYELAAELHARPFPQLTVPCQTSYLAVKRPVDAANRDRSLDREHLIALLNRHGAPHPPEGSNHYFGTLGRYRLKWECHTEFVTYTLFSNDPDATPFDANAFSGFPPDWLEEIPGAVLTSALVHIEQSNAGAEELEKHFVHESLAVAEVLDNSALIASDFRLDPNGHIRFAMFARDETGPSRVGRMVQRLLEIETYKSMAMLTLPIARKVSSDIALVDKRLTELVADMAARKEARDDTLDRLLNISSEIQHVSSDTAFRFSAAGAYAAIVNQRIDVLRETRYKGRQNFSEFMTRRFEPAMRTCTSTQERLAEISRRAERAAKLHSTRLEEARSTQNAALLSSMDRRAEQQLRLQKTVEGLSVVAIGYYAVNLLVYLLTPLAKLGGLDKTWLTALCVPVVLLVVWRVMRGIRKNF